MISPFESTLICDPDSLQYLALFTAVNIKTHAQSHEHDQW